MQKLIPSPVAKILHLPYVAAMAALLAVALPARKKSSDPAAGPGSIQPVGLAPAYAPTIDPQMLAVLEQYVAFGTPPLPPLRRGRPAWPPA